MEKRARLWGRAGQGADPPRDPGGFLPLGLRRSLGLFGPPICPTNLKMRPGKYVFMLRSILLLPGLEICFKSEKITKNWIYKKVGFQKMMK